jgi:hypothetical protein
MIVFTVWGTRGIFGLARTVVTVVGTMVGSGVGTRVASGVGAVGTSVTTGVVTAAGFTGWVHPLIIARMITRTNNPMNLFMEITLLSPCI